MGATAVTAKVVKISGNNKTVEALVTFSASYATGGDTVSLVTDLGMTEVNSITVPSHRFDGVAVTAAQAQTGKSVQLAGTNKVPLLKLYDTALTQVSNATDQSGVAIVIRFVGK